MPLKLTKRTVDAITPGDRASIVYDTDLKGFGVRIAADRSLSWFVEYRPGGGGRRVAKKRMVIGSREFTPEQARQAAKGILAAISLGSGEERKSDTFHEFAERYLREEAEAKLKVGTVVNYRICVRKHTVPEIGSIKLNRISTADISRIHTKVGQTRPMTANRIVECISSIFRYAATCNVVPVGHNPTKGIRAFRESRRERFLNSDELARLGSAIREAETVGIPYEIDQTKPTAKHAPKPESRRIKIDAYTAAALRLLILTGARLREILHLRWEYVDFQRGLLLLPDSKTGRKTIVLNAPALVLINTHWLPGQVSLYVKMSRWASRIDLVHEGELLGTGGTVLANRQWCQNQPFMLAHADNLTDFDVGALIAAHHARPPGNMMTMLGFRTDDHSSCGILELDDRGTVVAAKRRRLCL